MNPEELEKRTMADALRIIRLSEPLPENDACRGLGRQLLRSVTSAGAPYRTAPRAKSKPDFISKMDRVEDEADETLYWTKLLVEPGHVDPARLARLAAEGEEILRVTVASIHAARENLNTPARTRQAVKSAIRNPRSAME